MRAPRFSRPFFPNQSWRKDHGYASVGMVMVFAIVALLGMMFTFRQGVRSHESQVRNQVKIDYSQKEDALLRALIAIVPNKAIGAMQNNSASSANTYSWDTIFNEAILASNAENAISTAVMTSIGNPSIISANTGDTALTSASQIVGVVAGDGVLVGPGSSTNTGLIDSVEVAGKLPPPLDFSGDTSLDQTYPIITHAKTYPSSTPNLGASADPNVGWNLYNIIDYPDIRFGMATQDGKFVAKRNWWAFSLSFGANDTANSGVPVIKKNYVLSIYEVPGQHAMSAGARLQVGTFGKNGTAWQNTTIRGGVFGSEVETSGSLDLEEGGLISARRSISIGAGTSVDNGTAIADGFNALGAREARMAGSAIGQDFYGASIAADSGRVTILPLSQGEAFVRRDNTNGMSNTLAPTPWDRYALGARQCAMQLEIVELNGTKPTKVRFHYLNAGGNPASILFDENGGGGWMNGEWENHVEAFQDTSPIPFFQEKIKQTNTWGLGINLDKFPAIIQALGGSMKDNNSINIWANTTHASVSTPDPVTNDSNDMGITLRQCRNLQGFTNGLTIITPYRVYFAETFNQETQNKPANSGLPPGPFYPPVSVFTLQKRFGAMRQDPSSVRLDGQLNSLADDDGTAVNLLDLRTSAEDVNGPEGSLAQVMDTSTISADLSQIVSPAQLPPVNQMTWLVTIEEVHSGAAAP